MVGTGIQTPRQYTWQEITKKILTEFLRISNGFLNKFEKKMSVSFQERPNCHHTHSRRNSDEKYIKEKKNLDQLLR